MKITDDFEFRLFQHASGHFLCKEIPDNWEEMEEEEREEFLNDNAWESFENTPASEVLTIIENSAESTIKFMVKEGLLEK